MKPLNIQLNGKIGTSDEGLIQNEPSFEAKNTLLYKGIASNMRKMEGDGFLSTNGENIRVEGNTVYFGDVPNFIDNEWTCEDSFTISKNENECPIGDYSILFLVSIIDNNTLNLRKYEKGKYVETLRPNVHLSDNTKMEWSKIVECQNSTDQCIISAKFGNETVCYTYNVNTNTLEKWDIDSKYLDESSTLTSVTNITQTYKRTQIGITAVGIDNTDFRKRATYVRISHSGTSFDVFFRGMGCVDSKGLITGEPYLRHTKRGSFYGHLTYYDDNSIETKVVRGSLPSGWTLEKLSCNDIENDKRFTILDNGVISVWTGFHNPKFSYKDDGVTVLEEVTNQNAALGASLETNEGTQAGVEDGAGGWNPKIHSTSGGRAPGQPVGIYNDEDMYVMSPTEGFFSYPIYTSAKNIGLLDGEGFIKEGKRLYYRNNDGTVVYIKRIIDNYEIIDSNNNTVRINPYSIMIWEEVYPTKDGEVSYPFYTRAEQADLIDEDGFIIGNRKAYFRNNNGDVVYIKQILENEYQVVDINDNVINLDIPDEEEDGDIIRYYEVLPNGGEISYPFYTNAKNQGIIDNDGVIKEGHNMSYVDDNGRSVYIRKLSIDEVYAEDYFGNSVYINPNKKVKWNANLKKVDIPNDYDHNMCYDFEGDEAQAYQRAQTHDNSMLSDDFEWVLSISLKATSDILFTVETEHFLDTRAGGIYTNNYFISKDNIYSFVAPQIKTILGDYSYQFNSMQPYSETTDSSAIFPALRVFFNNSNAKGKYWDYGKGWTRCYKYQFGFSSCKKELVVFQSPLQIIENGTSYEGYDYQIGKDESSQYYVIKNKNLAYEPRYAECLDGLQYFHVIANTVSKAEFESPYKYKTDYILCYNEVQKSKGDKIYAPYDTWLQCFWSREDTDANNGCISYYPPIRKLRILGDGKGIQEPSANIGSYGDSTALAICNKTRELDSKLLRVGYLRNIPSEIIFNNTLIFSITDLRDNFSYTKSGENYNLKIYGTTEVSIAYIKHYGELKVDKLSDYMFRINTLSDKNVIIENKNEGMNLYRGFSGYIGEERFSIAWQRIKIGGDGIKGNNVFYYASGINSDMLEDNPPSALLPAKSVIMYVEPSSIPLFETETLNNRNPIIVNNNKVYNWTDPIDVYYTSSSKSTDVTYKYTSVLSPSITSGTEGNEGIKSYNDDMADFSWWIDSETVLYPIGIASHITGINYASATIDLPNNYSVRFYNNNNRTLPIYNEISQIYMGSRIFTIMGSNYYFDGQAVYYLGNTQSGGNKQYGENILIAYCVGMKFLCNGPSEAFFYSPYDKCMYLFTASNTMQKSTSLSRFGDIIDSCFCPVNQSIYVLFDGKLLVKSQDDMALFDVKGNRLITNSEGVQVISDVSYEMYTHNVGEYSDLYIETEWLGSADMVSKYSYVDIVFQKTEDEMPEVNVYMEVLNGIESKNKKMTEKIKDWQNKFYRLRVSPNEPIGNAFRIIISSKDKVGVYSLTAYSDVVSTKQGSNGWV